MIDEDFEFGRPGFFHTQWGLLVLMLSLIVMGIFWWNDSIEKSDRITELVKDNKRLSDRLADAESVAEESVYRTTAFKVAESQVPAQPMGANELPSSHPVMTEAGFDVEAFIRQVKQATTRQELAKLADTTDGIEAAITPLLALTETTEDCENGIVMLRLLQSRIPQRRKREVLNALMNVIGSNHLLTDNVTKGINHNAYAMLVSMKDEASPAIKKLKSIMMQDHSPWAGYACVTAKILDPSLETKGRMIELLSSPFDNNRLVVVRKLPEFLPFEVAKRELEKMYPLETNEEIKRSIINSMNRIVDNLGTQNTVQ